MSEKPSVPERAQAAFRQLSTAATGLNTASDELGKAIVELDAALRKLNLGISAWVVITSGAGYDGSYWSRNLGYARVGKEWGIALKDLTGDENWPEDEEEIWLFNDAPRWLRIEGVAKIPELLEKLTKQADETTEKIRKKTTEAAELAAAIKAAAAMSKPANKLTPPPDPLTLPPSWGEAGAKLPIPPPPLPLTPPSSSSKAGAKLPPPPTPPPARK